MFVKRLSTLRSLALDCINVDALRPETFGVVAMLCEMEGNKHRAVALVEQALVQDETHVFAHLLRGALSMTLENDREAFKSFREACRLSRDLSSYQGAMVAGSGSFLNIGLGMIQAEMSLGHHSNAQKYAYEALKLMPESPRALSLVALVLISTDGDKKKVCFCLLRFIIDASLHNKARSILQKALKIRPNCAEAVLNLADLGLKMDKNVFFPLIFQNRCHGRTHC